MNQKRPKGWVSAEDFSRCVNALPLVSVDLVILNENNELLLGLRNNRPAKGWWFTPGARVRKGEPHGDALLRVWQEELGQLEIPMPTAKLMGAWDHFYADSAFSTIVSTHYVNLPHVIRIESDLLLDANMLPNQQHSLWNWLSLAKASKQDDVHEYVRTYAQHLMREG